jgi:serine/threonine-protein kinase HipA
LELEVFLGERRVGVLAQPPSGDFSFTYDATWVADPERFALSPYLPLPGEADPARQPRVSPEHSVVVRDFFQNLLPEGKSLDAAAAVAKVSKGSLVGLLASLGAECMGALRILPPGVAAPATSLRAVTREELSQRIRERPTLPFSVWDGKVRLSIPGYQDKVALFVRGEEWFLAEGALASTHILKPEPVEKSVTGLTSNEFFCMRLAAACGLEVAAVQLRHLPEPVLMVERFDRRTVAGNVNTGGETVDRLHVMDGCQALGLPVDAKYERLYGSGKDVKHIRDGASLPHFFALQQLSAQPLAQRQKLLRWAIFQVLIGNTDAHAKNLSFFAGISGVSLAPAYDLVSTFAMNRAVIEDNFAMSIGDAFRQEEFSPFEWAVMAERCGLPKAQVGQELRRLAGSISKQLPAVVADCASQGADQAVLERIRAGIEACANEQLAIATRIARVSLD